MAHPNVEADKMLDVYIHDYFQKKKLSASAKAFQTEAEVPTDITAFDAPGGFLSEWWSVFWEIFIARYKRSRQSIAGANIEAPLVEGYEQHRNEQMQQLILQKQIEQQQQQREQRNKMQVQNETAFRRQNLGLTHESAKRIHQRSTKYPLQKDCMAMANMRMMYGNHSSEPESAANRNRVIDPRQALSDVPADNILTSNPMVEQSHQHLVPQDLRNMMNRLPNSRTASSDVSLYGVAESNQAIDKLPLRGWPLMGLDRLQAGILQQQKQLMLTSQQRHMRQQLQLLLNSEKNANLPMERQSSSGGSCIPDHSLWGQVGSPVSSGGDAELLIEASSTSIMRKRKQPMPSSNPTNSSESGRTQRLPADSAPSTQREDAIVMPTLNNDDSVKTHICGGLSTRTSSQRQLVHDGDPAIVKSLDDNVELLPHDSTRGQCLKQNDDSTFSQIGRIHVMPFNCFDLSSNGVLIATGGLDKKVVLWCTSFEEPKFANEGHSDVITDIRFSTRLSWMATSSLDKTIKIWDVDNLANSHRTFTRHSAPVVSVDFHPNKEDLICSSDDVSAIRYWSIKDNGCAGVSKGAAVQVRFQPTYGRYIAAAAGNGVSMIDVETTQASRYPFKCHESKVHSVCWNDSGDYMASMSEDLVKVWKIGSGEMKECIHELSISGKKICCCVFHPYDASLMVIGLEQSMELWHIAEGKKTMSVLGDPTTALAASQRAGLVASASDDNSIRLWK